MSPLRRSSAAKAAQPHRRRCIAVACAFLWMAGGSPAETRSHFKGKQGDLREEQEQGQAEAAPEVRTTVRANGLVAVFPREVTCPDIASPFGSNTRYDGSRRLLDRHGGLHGGMDITLDEGTRLRAIAAGQVISVGVGGLATGIYLWLRHSPEDSGLPFWLYSKYQHLREVPELRVGETVTVAQTIGLSGKTGTVGRHYGSRGYPHLHLTMWAGLSDRYEVRESAVAAHRSQIIDPLAVYGKELRELSDFDRLPGEQRHISIPYVAEDGSIHPAGSRLVWPVACKRR